MPLGGGGTGGICRLGAGTSVALLVDAPGVAETGALRGSLASTAGSGRAHIARGSGGASDGGAGGGSSGSWVGPGSPPRRCWCVRSCGARCGPVGDASDVVTARAGACSGGGHVVAGWLGGQV